MVFGHGEWFTREVLEELSRASFYRGDLDLVAVAPGGDVASFCTFRMDPPSRVTELEPKGTLPEYRRLGLAKVLGVEGFVGEFRELAQRFEQVRELRRAVRVGRLPED